MIFKDENDRLNAVTQLASLKDHPAWVYIERALDENIEHTKQQLETSKDFDNIEQVFALQDRIDDLAEFKSLPETLITEAKNLLSEQEDDSDPYNEDPGRT